MAHGCPHATSPASGRVFARVCREREGPVAAGRPLAQMSPGLSASSFILPRGLSAATRLGLWQAGETGCYDGRRWVGRWAPMPLEAK